MPTNQVEKWRKAAEGEIKSPVKNQKGMFAESPLERKEEY